MYVSINCCTYFPFSEENIKNRAVAQDFCTVVHVDTQWYAKSIPLVITAQHYYSPISNMTEDGVGDYINLLSLRQLAEIQRLLQWHT